MKEEKRTGSDGGGGFFAAAGRLFATLFNTYLKPQTAEGISAAIPAFALFGEKPERRASALLKKAGGVLLNIAAAFFFSRAGAAFSVYPFGISFLAACGRYTLASALGALAGALSLGANGFVYVVSSLMTVAIRALASYWISVERHREREEEGKPKIGFFLEGVKLKCASVCVAAFAVGSYNIVVGGYTYYDLGGAMLLMLLCPASVLLFSPIIEGGGGKIMRRVSASALCLCAVYSLSSVSLFGVSLGVLAAYFITVMLSKSYGPLVGGGAGLLLGLCASAAYCPLFAVAGLVGGLLFHFSNFLGICGALICSLLFCGYSGGLSALTSLSPAIILASAVSYPTLRFCRRAATAADEAPADANLPTAREKSLEARIESLGETLSSLSEMLYTLSDRARVPDLLDIRAVCDAVCDRYCAPCKNNPLCWEKEYTSTADALSRISRELARGGRADAAAVPAFLAERCASLDAILKEINSEVSALVEKALRRGGVELFAFDYDAISKLLSDALAKTRAEYEPDEENSETLSALAKRMQIADSVRVFGSRKKFVMAANIAKGGAKPRGDEIARVFGEALGCVFAEPCYSVDSARVSMTVSARPKLSATLCGLERAADGSRLCGDTLCDFVNREGRFYAMISDGMGAGRDAALTSGICELFITKMLSAGNSKETTLEMLNAAVRAKSFECSATIDLFELDLYTGKASFVKSGAAPSYIKRGDKLYKIDSKTLPLGILTAIDAERVRFDLRDGDAVIMVSDGAAQVEDDMRWLPKMLAGEWIDDADKMTAAILDRAAQNAKRRDDMTAAIIKIKSV